MEEIPKTSEPIIQQTSTFSDKVKDFFHSLMGMHLFAKIGIIVIVLALPVTVIVLQQQTNIFQHAASNCSAYGGLCVPSGICNAANGFPYCGGAGAYGCASSQKCGSSKPLPSYSGDPCQNAGCGDGWYCSGQCGVNGNASTRYYCVGNVMHGSEACPYGCQVNSGSSDTCKAPPPTSAPAPTSNLTGCVDFNLDFNTYPQTNAGCQQQVSQGNASTTGSNGYPQKIVCSSPSSYKYYYIPAASTMSPGQYLCTVNNSSIYSCATTTGDSSTPNNQILINGHRIGSGGQYCSSNQYCSGTGSTPSSVCHNINPNSCTCTGTTSFKCDGISSGSIQRSCGSGLTCGAKGSQGPWPCVKQCPDGFLATKNGNQWTCPSQGNSCPSSDYSAQGISAPGSTTPVYRCFYTGTSTPGGGPVPPCASVGGTCQYADCTNGPTTQAGSCSSIYMQCCKPSASSNPCANVKSTASGRYCGTSTQNGFQSDGTQNLYQCNGDGTTVLVKDCSNDGGCVVAGKGNDDYCKNTGGGCDPSTQNCGGGNPTPTPPSCTPGQDTKFALNIKLDGIGTGSFENTNPLHPKRTGTVRIFDTSNTSGNLNSSSQAFNFGKNDGTFDSATIDLGLSTLTCGKTYKVEVKLPGYLPATADVKYGDTSQNISMDPIGGDVNRVDTNGVVIGDGKIDINDYSVFRQCRNVDPGTTIPFQSNTTTINVKCGDLINFFDFQDGGTMENIIFTPSGGASVGEWDANYNLWLRSYIKANGL